MKKEEFRLLSVVTQLEAGGAQAVAFSIHNYLAEQGIVSTLVFLYEKDGAAFPVRNFETILQRVPTGWFHYLYCLIGLARAWWLFRPSHIIAHTHYAIVFCGIVKLLLLRGKLIGVHHNSIETYPAFSRWAIGAMRRGGLFSSEIAVSESVKASVAKTSPNAKVTVVLNSHERRPTKLSRPEARKSFGLPAGAWIVGTVGRLADQKNQQFLIELLPNNLNFKLAIVGSGALFDHLTNLADRLGVRDRVKFLGSIIPVRMGDFYAAIDIFALPSLFEGRSIAMLEALDAGVPFIGNDAPGIRDVCMAYTRPIKYCLLPLDADLWSRQFQSAQRDDYQGFVLAGSKSDVEGWSVADMSDAYLSAIR